MLRKCRPNNAAKDTFAYMYLPTIDVLILSTLHIVRLIAVNERVWLLFEIAGIQAGKHGSLPSALLDRRCSHGTFAQ